MTKTLTIPTLTEGEFHAGLIIKDDGTPDYFLIGLPGELDSATWQQAIDWAKQQGGDLPSLRELNLLRANARQYFKDDLYWSNETHHSESGWAWLQYFGSGGQDYRHQTYEFRARAVRRLVI